MKGLVKDSAGEVLSLWRYMARGLGLLDLDQFEFEQILITKDQPRLRDGIIEWWPRGEIARRHQTLEEKGPFAAWWMPSKKGTQRTADLLWEARDNPDDRAMVLLAAAIWDLSNPLHENWRGEPFRLAGEVLHLLTEELWSHGIGTWHHACREALPCSISFSHWATGALRPSELHELLLVAGMSVALTRATWAPVVVRKAVPGMRLVEPPSR